MASQADKIVVLITAADVQEAEKISSLLVAKRKVACCNTVPSVQSTFRWQGKVENESESLLICKTRRAALPAVIELVKSVHSYNVPEIIALPVIGGSDDYFTWMDEVIDLPDMPAQPC